MSGIEILWAVTSALVSLLIGAGIAFALAGAGAGEFRATRVFIIVAAVVLGAMTVYWLTITERPPLIRVLVGIVVGAAIVAGVPESFRWIEFRFQQAEIKQEESVRQFSEFLARAMSHGNAILQKELTKERYPELNQWKEDVEALIREGVGEAEVKLFDSNAGLLAMGDSSPSSQIRTAMDRRMQRLIDLVRRLDRVSIRRDFDPSRLDGKFGDAPVP